jgi:G3E family GTPase
VDGHAETLRLLAQRRLMLLAVLVNEIGDVSRFPTKSEGQRRWLPAVLVARRLT